MKTIGDKEGAIESCTEAYETCKLIMGQQDILTSRCLVNLAGMFLFYEMHEEAKIRYQIYLDGWHDFLAQDTHQKKLRKTVLEAMESLKLMPV